MIKGLVLFVVAAMAQQQQYVDPRWTRILAKAKRIHARGITRATTI
jgi:hypothetical protein